MRYCVFVGSSTGHDANFRKAADCLGAALAQRGIGLVYGGASVGLMGIVADAAQSHGGEVIGVIPRSLVVADDVDALLSALFAYRPPNVDKWIARSNV